MKRFFHVRDEYNLTVEDSAVLTCPGSVSALIHVFLSKQAVFGRRKML
jgi:hypothetical protein